MSRYTHRCVIAVPVTYLAQAVAIGRAMDPDMGGAFSFEGVRALDADGFEWAICDTPCIADFAATAMVLTANPEMLHYLVVVDYATRWPGLPVPSLEDCEAFCSMVAVVAGSREAVYWFPEPEPASQPLLAADGLEMGEAAEMVTPLPPVLVEDGVTLASALAAWGLTLKEADSEAV